MTTFERDYFGRSPWTPSMAGRELGQGCAVPAGERPDFGAPAAAGKVPDYVVPLVAAGGVAAVIIALVATNVI